jgi:hypothetical protein
MMPGVSQKLTTGMSNPSQSCMNRALVRPVGIDRAAEIFRTVGQHADRAFLQPGQRRHHRAPEIPAQLQDDAFGSERLARIRVTPRTPEGAQPVRLESWLLSAISTCRSIDPPPPRRGGDKTADLVEAIAQRACPQARQECRCLPRLSNQVR